MGEAMARRLGNISRETIPLLILFVAQQKPSRGGLWHPILMQFYSGPLMQLLSGVDTRGYRTAPATLAKLASIGGGPTFESFGRKPLYREADLLAWAQAKTTGPRRSTIDPGARPSSGGAA